MSEEKTDEKPTFSRKKPPPPAKSDGSPKKSFDLEKKIESIKSSKMPDWQKEEYILKLKGEADDGKERIPFSVYSKVKQLPKNIHSAMLAWPKARGIKVLTIQEWDELFKEW